MSDSLDEAVEAALKARKWTPDDIGYWHGLGVDAASRVDLSRFVKITAHVGEGWNTALAVAGEIADAITPLTDQLPEPNRRAIGGIREGLRSGIYSRLMRARGRSE